MRNQLENKLPIQATSKSLVLYSLFFLLYFPCISQSSSTFTNPLLSSGADPWSIYKDGYYYYTNTRSDSLVLYKTKNLAHLRTAERKTIFVPPKGTPYSKQIWAPELHLIDNKWYMYFAADSGRNEDHRLYVLENRGEDPMTGSWEMKGKIADSSDKWAIDGSVFEHKGKLYFIWSGWEGDQNGQQDIYIASMKNPWTLDSKRVRISSPVFEWERHGTINNPSNTRYVYVNEGPQILKRNDDIFLIYSASGCWTDNYALGMLSIKSWNNLLDSASWKRHREPVFKQSIVNGVYAPGHNSFFKSPDGTEDWILYHANDQPGQGCGRYRSPRAQRFSWNKDGTPNFGEPVKPGVPIPIPSEKKLSPVYN
jgi:GH43 family beta-xylosidase